MLCKGVPWLISPPCSSWMMIPKPCGPCAGLLHKRVCQCVALVPARSFWSGIAAPKQAD